MKTIITIILLCISLSIFSQMQYEDLDVLLGSTERLETYCKKGNFCYTYSKANAKSNHYDFFTITGNRMSIDIYYNERGIVRRLDIYNPPYKIGDVSMLCLYNRHTLCYIYVQQTYNVYLYNGNTITLILHD